MIHNTLDLESEPMLRPELFYGKREKVCDICIITFSQAVMEWALEHLECQRTAVIRSVNGDRPIYVTEVNGVRTAFYMTYMSSAEAAGCLEEARCLTGAEHYIMFGACGSLNQQVTEGKLIVPDYACRDEGLSYHYLAPEEYIRLENTDKVAGFMERNRIPYVTGRTWTTDAIYRETQNKVERRRQEGCIAVEMECAGVEAVCRFYGLHFYNFLFAGDFFEPDGWNKGNLGGKQEEDLHVRCFQIALKMAEETGTLQYGGKRADETVPPAKEECLCDDIRYLTDRALWETENLIKCIHKEFWDKRYDGIPMWKYVYHMLYSMDRWYINPGDITYQNPFFHTETLADLNVVPGEGETLRHELVEEYFYRIKRKIRAYTADLKDEDLNNRPENCDISRLRLILGQFRHWHRHMGIIYGFIVEDTGKWPYVLNMYGKYPKEPMPNYF